MIQFQALRGQVSIGSYHCCSDRTLQQVHSLIDNATRQQVISSSSFLPDHLHFFVAQLTAILKAVQFVGVAHRQQAAPNNVVQDQPVALHRPAVRVNHQQECLQEQDRLDVGRNVRPLGVEVSPDAQNHHFSSYYGRMEQQERKKPFLEVGIAQGAEDHDEQEKTETFLPSLGLSFLQHIEESSQAVGEGVDGPSERGPVLGQDCAETQHQLNGDEDDAYFSNFGFVGDEGVGGDKEGDCAGHEVESGESVDSGFSPVLGDGDPVQEIILINHNKQLGSCPFYAVLLLCNIDLFLPFLLKQSRFNQQHQRRFILLIQQRYA